VVKKLKYLVVIPARYSSTRLPGKPLIDICGLPMIIRTCRQCLKTVPSKNLIVATDDKRVVKCCEKSGIQTILTSKRCLTGTDRVAEVARKIKVKHYINVQGDEPIFNPNDLKKIIKETFSKKKEILLGYTKIRKKSDYNNKSVPKIVFDKNKNLLYASRAPIPSSKENKIIQSWRQVLAYSFPRKKLLQFAKIKKKLNFEKFEDIEILRFLEMGYRVKLVKMSSKSCSIDTRKDLKFIRKLLKKK